MITDTEKPLFLDDVLGDIPDKLKPPLKLFQNVRVWRDLDGEVCLGLVRKGSQECIQVGVFSHKAKPEDMATDKVFLTMYLTGYMISEGLPYA
jgi:hypothetical protein